MFFGCLWQTNENVYYQTKIAFSFKPRDKLQQPQQQPQQRQQNDHRPNEEIQSSSGDFMSEIAINYQPHQPPKATKFPETVYGKQNFCDIANIFCEENERRRLIFGRF